MTATGTNSKKPLSLWTFIEILTSGEVQSASNADPPWFEAGKTLGSSVVRGKENQSSARDCELN